MAEKDTLAFEELFNKKERLKVIKQAILTHLNRTEESKRDTIVNKLHDIQIDENPYEVYRGGTSRQILVQPTNEEITYCLNYLKDKGLIIYHEARKIWILTTMTGEKKKIPTLDDFLEKE